MNRSRPGLAVEFLFLATVFTVSFAKLQWEVAGTLSLSDVLTGIFLVAWIGTRVGTGDRRLAWGAAVAGLFFVGFLAVYLIGFFNLETEQSLAQWAKGMFKFLLHFGFLVVGLAYMARRSERFYWTTFAVFMAGFVANAVYGIVQLGTAEVLGINLDQSLLSPITGGASQINIYGAIEGASVFRPNALTGDPNHLGIELVIPLLVLTPLYLRLERGHRLKLPLALVLAFLLLVELATLSRSGLLGLAAGLLVLAIPYRHRVATPEFLLPLGRRRRRARDRACGPLAVLRAGAALARGHVRERHLDAFRRLRLHPGRALVAPALRAGAEQLLRLLRVRHRPDELRPAFVLRRDAGRDRAPRDGALHRVPRLPLQAARAAAGDRALRSSRRGSGRSRGG